MANSPIRNARFTGLLLALVMVAAAIFFLRRTADEIPAGSAPGSSAAAESAAAVQAGSAPTTSEQATDKAGDSAGEWRERKRREGVDAANLYADAFVLFQKLTDEEKNMIRKPGDEVDAEKAAALYAKLQPIMELLRQAAKADFCDWGTGEINFETSLPHITKANDLGRLALWAAGYRFHTDPNGAIEDLAVRGKLGHHLADTLIGALVQASFEASAHSLLETRMRDLDAATTQKALAFVNSSTLDRNLSRAFTGEATGAESALNKLKNMDPITRAQQIAAWGGVQTRDDPGWVESAARVATGFMAGSRLERDRAFLRDVYAQAPDVMRGPDAEFQSWWQRVSAEAGSQYGLARLTLPALNGVQMKMQQLRVQRALLTAGADVLQHGPAQVGHYRDPATGSALQYVPTTTGFELRSTYMVKGKPVTAAFQRLQ